MPQTLLLEIARSNLHSLECALKEEKLPAHHTVADMIYISAMVADMVCRFWEELRSLIEEGIEGRQLSQMLKQQEELVGSWMLLVRDFQERMALLEVAQVGMSKLTDARHRLQQIQEESASLRKWIDIAPPVLSPEAIHQFEQSTSAGGYETGEAILSRLQQGGDL